METIFWDQKRNKKYVEGPEKKTYEKSKKKSV